MKLKESRFPIFCRPNSTDAEVLWATFYNKYHLPPHTLDRNSIILDLGANIGHTMAHFAFRFPTSRIYGVEMDYENFLLAQKNIAPLGNQCKIIHTAVWKENEIISYGGSGENGYSLVREDQQNKMHTTQGRTIECILEENNLMKIDYLKMDIEGAEKVILENSEKWIDKIKSMRIEIHPPVTVEDCERNLVKNGFVCTQDKTFPMLNIFATRQKT
ncbi:MAG: FkbM family methyltransferase [Thaumarchaeota archaeon]|nr:FkbM family methyltransferase [Nitrososphaerota archaeon]